MASPTITTAPRSRISRVPGFDTATIAFTSDVDYQAYELRVVNSDIDLHTDGTLIESGGGGLAGVERAVDITDDELVAALGAAVDGSNLIRIFVQDMAGNWSGTYPLYADTMLYNSTMFNSGGLAAMSAEATPVAGSTVVDASTPVDGTMPA